MEIEAGNYLAKIVDCGLSKTKKGVDQAFVTFELENGKRLNWYGSLSDQMLKSGQSVCMLTINQLLKMGFTANWTAFGEGGDLSECFNDPSKAWDIKVEMREWNGKVFPSIKYINDPAGRSQTESKLDKAQATEVITSKNLKALTLQAKQMMTPTKAPTQNKISEPAKNAVDDIFG